MAMDPQTKQLLTSIARDDLPSIGEMTPQQMRDFYLSVGARLGGESRPMAEIRDIVAGEPGNGIPLRLYRPEGQNKGPSPALIYVHGGGWVMGSLDSHDKVCRRLAHTCGCTVISVKYRLAPEHPFPAGPTDVFAATRWILAHVEALGIDSNRIGIAGDSAGGGLSAVTCIALRDVAGPKLRCQILIYPGVDNRPEANDRTSRVEQAHTPPLPAPAMQAMVKSYLPIAEEAYDWRASPLLAHDLRELPAALVITGGYDPLRDEGIDYAQRLAVAGVEVLHRHFAGQIHGFIEMGGELDAVDDAMRTIGFWLDQTFKCPPAATQRG